MTSAIDQFLFVVRATRQIFDEITLDLDSDPETRGHYSVFRPEPEDYETLRVALEAGEDLYALAFEGTVDKSYVRLKFDTRVVRKHL